MKKYFAFILFAIVCQTYSQTNTNEIDMPIGNLPDSNIPVRTLSDVRNEELNYNINDVRDKNYDKALDVVAPINGIGSDNSGQETVSSLSMKEANKVKLVDYSNVRPSDVYTTNEDGTRTAKGDSYNSTTGEVSNDKEVDNSFNNEQTYNRGSSSLGGKLFKIGGIIALWFLVGFLINFFFYSGKPDYLLGKSQTAKNFHIILNIVTGIALLANIFS
jgi:uncharacterized membrane protein YgaE (UPF0421/DUF939 family)